MKAIAKTAGQEKIAKALTRRMCGEVRVEVFPNVVARHPHYLVKTPSVDPDEDGDVGDVFLINGSTEDELAKQIGDTLNEIARRCREWASMIAAPTKKTAQAARKAK